MKLVKIWAPWCGPCKSLAPQIDLAAEETGIEVRSVNVDEDPQEAGALDAMSVPTVILVDENETEVARFTGFRPSEAIVEFINENK